MGDMITPGTSDNSIYNHFSLLKTIQDNWQLGGLGRNDDTANLMFALPNVPTNSPAPTNPTDTPAPTNPTSSQSPTQSGSVPTVPATFAPTSAPTRDTTPCNVSWSFLDQRTRIESEVRTIIYGILRSTTITIIFHSKKRADEQTKDPWTASITDTDTNTTNRAEAEALANYLRGASFIGIVDTDNVLVNGENGASNKSAVIAVAVILSIVAVVLIICIIVAIVYFTKKKDETTVDYNMY